MEENDTLYQQNEIKRHRLSEYKSRTVVCDQTSRRLQLLLDQKRKREETINAARNNTQLLHDSDHESDKEEEAMEWTESKPKQPRLKDMFMFSEWMIDIPEDFEEKWLFVMCPVGKRCIVRCTKGSTSVYGKRGDRLAKFQSRLPNGSRKDYTGNKYSNSEVTILDCIWDSQTNSYFILDLLCWKNQLYMDTETSFRVFWVKSKIEEMPWLMERSQENPFPFIPLKHYSCDRATISEVMSRPYFPSDEPKVDGILFYHSEAFYTPGYTPLVVWLKPFMVPEVFGVMISDQYEESKPSSYVNKQEFIASFEEKSKMRKHRRPRKSKELANEVEMLELE